MKTENERCELGRQEGTVMLKPTCVLIGTDANVFAIIGKVSRALKDAGMSARAKEFSGRAFEAGSYGEVLQLVEEYVEVE